MSILPPLNDYKTPTEAQQRILAKLLSIDEDMVTVVIPTQKIAAPFLTVAVEINRFKSIKDYVKKHGLSITWLRTAVGHSMVEGKGRWNQLVKFLKKEN